MSAQGTRQPIAGQGSGSSLLRRAIPVVVAIIGLWLLVQSTSLGLGAAESMVSAATSMPTEQFLRLLDAQAAAYRLLGAVLLGAGAARTLFDLK